MPSWCRAAKQGLAGRASPHRLVSTRCSHHHNTAMTGVCAGAVGRGVSACMSSIYDRDIWQNKVRMRQLSVKSFALACSTPPHTPHRHTVHRVRATTDSTRVKKTRSASVTALQARPVVLLV